MFSRPRADETDEDLLKQDANLSAQGTFTPSVKFSSTNKRKTEEDPAHAKPQAQDEVQDSKPKSRFAEGRSAKKKKDGIVDNTVIKEAASSTKKVAVLGRIVERSVPSDDSFYKNWQPQSSPYGFPRPQKIDDMKDKNSSTATTVPGTKRKSLYMQHLEKQGLLRKPDLPKPNAAAALAQAQEDPRLAALGNHSYIIKGSTAGLDKVEVDKIHQENLGKIASMSHEERLKEQKELLSALSPEQISFLQSMQKLRESKIQGRNQESGTEHHINRGAGVSQTGPIKEESMSGEMETTSGDTDILGKAEDSPEEVSESEPTKKETKVKFSEDIEMKEIPFDPDDPSLDLPIPPSEARKWVHMDKVEMGKLSWMRNLPKPKPLNLIEKEGYVARFNFEGDILPYDADVSYRDALHYHQEEPNRAGYTLDELFGLIRSRVLKQRTIGLRILGNILRNTKEGLYDTCVNPPIFQLLVESGVVLVLRFALDDTSPLVHNEAVRTLYYLVVSEGDETCLALAQPWVPGGLHPGISSDIHASEKSRQELDTEEEELQDVEVIKLDIIRALVRMDTILRLRYLLEVSKPPPETVINILGILTRITRHSLTATWKLVQTPRLMSVIIDNFLPHNLFPLMTGENVTSLTSVYGVPLKHALHLFKVIAARGRQLAAVLVNTYDLMDRILTCVSVEPSEVGMPVQEVLALSQEAYETWATLLVYGLSKAESAAISFYPLLVKQLMFYRDRVDVNENLDSNKLCYDVGTHMINAMSRIVNIAATQSLLHNRMKLNQGTLVGADGKAQVLVPPQITWDDLRDLPQLVETCLKKWLTQLMRSNQTSLFVLRLIGSCCNFLDKYYLKWKDQSSYSGEVCTTKIKQLHDDLSSFLCSPVFQKKLGALLNHSALLCDKLSESHRDPVNLSSLGCVMHGGKVIPLVLLSSPFPLLLPLASLLVSLHSLHPGLGEQSTSVLLESEELCSYFQGICDSSLQLSKHWLTRIEIHFIYDILQLAALKGCTRRQLFHETAMCILPSIRKGDEHLVKMLLSSVVCSSEFLTDLSGISACVDNLTITDYKPLKSPALKQPSLSPVQLTKNISECIKSIGSELISCLVSTKEYDASAVLMNQIPFITNGITINQTEFPLVLDMYWPIKPIKDVFNKSREPPLNENQRQPQVLPQSDQSSPEDILTVSRCLQMTYLALKYRRYTALHNTTTTAWMQHLSLVFLVASDMFLDATINSYLQGCLYEIFRNEGYTKLQPENALENFKYGTEWYRQMLEQFTGVSYSDSTFALFLILPLQQYWPIDYRKELWGDSSDALSFIRLTPDEIQQFIPMKQFLEPVEESDDMITLYRSGIGTELVSKTRNPFMYNIASHHIKQYFQKQSNKMQICPDS